MGRKMKNPVCSNSGRQVFVGIVHTNRIDYAIPKEQKTIKCAKCGKELKRSTLVGEVLTYHMTRLFEIMRYHKATPKKEVN